MLLDTSKDIAGAKVLAVAPKFLEGMNFNEQGVILQFESLTDFRLAMDTYKDARYNCEMESMNTGRKDWAGSADWAEYLTHLEHGDPRVLDKIANLTKETLKKAEHRLKIVRPEYKMDVTGEFFDVGQVLQNIPEAWLHDVNGEDEKPRVELLINMSVASYVDPDHVTKMAAKVLAIAGLLEKMGTMVRITALETVSNYHIEHSGKLAIICAVKDYDEVIDYNKVASLINVGYCRRGCFKLFEQVAQDNLKGGYGRPINDLKHAINISNDYATDSVEHKLFGAVITRDTDKPSGCCKEWMPF